MSTLALSWSFFQYFHISPLAFQLAESGCGYCMKLNTTIVGVVNRYQPSEPSISLAGATLVDTLK